jgi:Short C-terminal domain
LVKKRDGAPAGDSPETPLALTTPAPRLTFRRMKKILPVIVIVGLAGVVAQCIGLPDLLKTGTCASGNTPYVIAHPCPSGTGGYIGLFGGGMTIAILAMVAASFSGNGLFGGAALLLWGAQFAGVGATVLVWALTHGNGPAGSKLASYIIAIVFIPMGAIPLLFGIRGWIGGAGDKMSERRSKVADAVVSRVDELQRYGQNQARIRITYTVTGPDGANFELSRETNAIISHMPRSGDRAKLRYDPRNLDHVEVLSSGAGAGAGSATPATPAAPSIPATVSIPGIPGDTGSLPWASSPVAVARQPSTNGDSLAQLKKLSDLHDSGALTDSEFAMEKAKILAQP